MIKIQTDFGRVYAKDETSYEFGNFFVGVTTVLDCLMDSKLKEFLINNDKASIEAIQKNTAKSGTSIHSLIERDLKGESLIVDEKFQKAFDLWSLIRDKHKISGIHTEMSIINEDYGYAGTADIIGNFTSCDSKGCCFNKIDKTCIMDIKTGTYKIQTGWQLAAYRAAAIKMGIVGQDCGCVGIHVKRDGLEGRPYVMSHIDPCFETFLHALQVWKFLNFNKLSKSKWKYLKQDALKKYWGINEDSN